MTVTVFCAELVAPTVLLGTLVCLLYVWCRTKHQEAMKRTGMKGPMPIPIFGTAYQQLIFGQMQPMLDNVKKYGKVHVGKIEGRLLIAVSDVEILKQIMVKDFQYFTNRRKVAVLMEKPISKMMTMTDDEEWKNIRKAVTPAFSAGKLRKMEKDINHCAEMYVKNLSKITNDNEQFDVKTLSSFYAGDLIARVAFGVEIDSQNNPKHPFVRHLNEILDFRFSKNPRFLIAFFLPILMPIFKKTGFSFPTKEASEYFTSIVEKTIESRREGGHSERADFLQLMVDAMSHRQGNSHKDPLTFEEVLSNCFIFFFAGFSNIGDSICFALYSLAKHPDMQEKVYDEINSVIGDKKSCSYDDLKEMVFFDMFMHEVLRVNAPVLAMDRECSQDVVIKGMTFPKDSFVAIQIHAIHNDPDYWPDPEKFDPGRFSPDKKAEMNPYTWLPFGYGPRHCVAMRLALIEVKIGVVHLVRKFVIKLASPDQQLKRNILVGSPINLHLKVEARDA